MAAAVGFDPIAYLHAEGDVRAIYDVVVDRLTQEFDRLEQQRIDALAAAVGNAVGAVFSGKRRGRKR